MGGSPPPPSRPVPNASGTGGTNCPSKLTTVISAPAQGVMAGEWLDVLVEREGGYPRIVLVDEITSARVGSLAGIPNLDVLIGCLEEGVTYSAFVDRVDGGRVDVTLIRR